MASGRPQRDEANEYYFKYIDLIPSDDVVSVLTAQLESIPKFLRTISEEKSLHKYAPEKWSIREVWSHVNDVERVQAFRALWFGRGFDTALPSYEQIPGTEAAQADDIPWHTHLDEFEAVRRAALFLFRNFPEDAWSNRGVASGNPVSVRALAYIIAGHADHHLAILKERYV